jgi:putative transposase
VSLGFRAHHAKEVYVYAKSLVESARSNGSRKLVLRRLSARVDRYDYKPDLDSMFLTLKLHSNYEVRLRLVAPRERVERVVKYDGKSFWVSVYFRRVVRPLEPRTVMAIDLNFDNVTIAIFTLDGRLLKLKRVKTPHRKVLTHRIWIERIPEEVPEVVEVHQGR